MKTPISSLFLLIGLLSSPLAFGDAETMFKKTAHFLLTPQRLVFNKLIKPHQEGITKFAEIILPSVLPGSQIVAKPLMKGYVDIQDRFFNYLGQKQPTPPVPAQDEAVSVEPKEAKPPEDLAVTPLPAMPALDKSSEKPLEDQNGKINAETPAETASSKTEDLPANAVNSAAPAA